MPGEELLISIKMILEELLESEKNMSVTKENIENKIGWFNNEVVRIKNSFQLWISELGHQITAQEVEITKTEEPSGTYKTKQFDFIMDGSVKISLIPYGIWIIGAKGRIDIHGPSGTEKLLFFATGGPGVSGEINVGRESENGIKKINQGYFDNVDEENWYWYDDSSYRKVAKFSKEIINSLLERLQ